MKETLILANRPPELIPALERLETLLNGEGVPPELIREVRLIAEEGISNIIYHAYEGDEAHRIEVTLAVESQEIRLELRDDGKPFDPLRMPTPDPDQPMDERPAGGLGILLMKNLTDEASYVREQGRNVLVLKKRF